MQYSIQVERIESAVDAFLPFSFGSCALPTFLLRGRNKVERPFFSLVNEAFFSSSRGLAAPDGATTPPDRSKITGG
jgi:hypothetical protein